MFEFMYKIWTIPIINMMHSTSQNYTNMVVGEHGIRTFKVAVVMLLLLLLSLMFFCPHKCTCVSKRLDTC